MEKEFQEFMKKMNEMKAKFGEMNNHQTTSHSESFNGIDNQSENFVTSVGNGEFDNQGPDPQKYYRDIVYKDPVITPGTHNHKNISSYNIPNVNSIGGGLQVCPDCKMIHPPLQQGQECPTASVSKKAKESNMEEHEINNFLNSLRNIIMSNMSTKKIKNGTKFFQYAIIELTKSLEGYKE